MALRVGVVGMGLMGEVHAKVYRSLPGVQLAGVVEIDSARRTALESQFGVPVYQRIADLLPHVDAISVCTPDHLHKEPILEAFRSRVKVLVEKPLGISSREAQEIIDHRPDPTFLMVGHLLRFDPRVIHCKEVIESGKLGKLWHVKIWRHNSLNAALKFGPRSSVTWFLGIHDLEILLHLTGLRIESVSAAGKKLVSQNWDLVQTHLELEGGVTASMENSWILPVQRSSGLDAGIKIVGEKGMIEINLSHSDVTLSTTEDGRQMNLDTYHWPVEKGLPHGDLRRELQAFVSCAVSNLEPPVTGEQALAAVQGIERIEEYLQSGGHVSRRGIV